MTEPSQWTAVNLQVVNWGGFEGHKSVPFSPQTTALTGVSGAGKSTLMDAYIALMMDANTPFNSASNDNTTGGARSDTQRNVLSYMRGKIDNSREGGSLTAQVLRGQGEATWSAVSMTWTDGANFFTAIRIYYARPTARKYSDIAPHFATVASAFSLGDLEPFAEREFDHRTVRQAFPSVSFNRGPSEFANVVQTTLGIGDPSHPEVGAKALKLLARVQQGGQVSRVNTLYTETVLEVPDTFEHAKRAMDHIRDMETIHQTMIDAEAQIEVLRNLDRTYEALVEAQSAATAIRGLGVSEGSGFTPWGRWSTEREIATLDRAIEKNRSARTVLETQLTAANLHAEEARRTEASLRSLVSAQGGSKLALMERDISDARTRLDATVSRHTEAVHQTATAKPDLSSKESLAAAQLQGGKALASITTRRPELQASSDELRAEGVRVSDRRLKNLTELSSLDGRDSLIDSRRDAARAQIAKAVGLNPEDLPFIAELVDVAPSFERWRTAANLALGGWSTHLLVDERILPAFKRTINDLNIRPRVKYKGVRIGSAVAENSPLSTLPGRLVIKEASPFAGWISSTLANQFNFVCVEDIRDLEKHVKTLTVTGQMNDGKTGAHGDSGFQQTLGFSNRALVARIKLENESLLSTLGLLQRQANEAQSDLAELDAEEQAWHMLAALAWATIDVPTASEDLKTAEKRLLDFTAENDTLAELQKDLADATLRFDTATRNAGAAEGELRRANDAHGRFVDREDFCKDLLDRLDRDGVVLTDDQKMLLDQDPASELLDDADALNGMLKRLATSLTNRRSIEERAVSARLSDLQSMFTAYLRLWKDPNMSDHPTDAYPAFKEKFDWLIRTGLHQARRKFSETVNGWAAGDLGLLNGSYSSAHSSIRQRLNDVNEVLKTIPFGAQSDRLVIKLRDVISGEVAEFRAELQNLAAYSTTVLEDDQIEGRWQEIRRFTRWLDPDLKGGARDRVLDVRRHVHIEAERVDADKNSLAVYDTLGDKSGGETQELVAFIVGAALRYQLGDAGLDRPRYRPVFLDEGFIKADSEFAGRSVEAWLQLGFQLIIGAPLDKITGLEPHVDSLLMVLKHDNKSHLVPIYSLEDEAFVAEAAQ